MKKLKIAQIAPPFLTVPPRTFGGTEAVVSNITEELVKRGHDVTLFASGDSHTSAKLESTFSKALNYEDLEQMLSPLSQKMHWMYSLPLFYHTVGAFEQADSFDIIHDHTHYLSCFFSGFVKTPLVATYHGSFTLAEQSPIEKLLLKKYKGLYWTAISNSQKNESTIDINFAATIHHGLHINEYLYQETPKDYLVWLGRITDRKGIKEAIIVAQKLEKKLLIAGNIKQRDQEYFDQEIKPALVKGHIEYLGQTSLEEKVNLLRNAKALLYPVKWEEPFGMVMIEAMAVGTPVIGFARGAVPEVIRQNETGFVVKDLEEMIEKTKMLYDMPQNDYTTLRKKSREHVETHFTVEQMVDQYEELYYKILSKK